MDERGSHLNEDPQKQVWTGKPCPHCGSSDILSGLECNLNAEVGPFGLSYRAVAFFRGTEKLYVDLCRACGTIQRQYVKNPSRNWVQSTR